MGTFGKDKVTLVDGQTFVFDMSDEPGDSYRVKLPHPEILNTLRVGDFLLLGLFPFYFISIYWSFSASMLCTSSQLNKSQIYSELR